MCRVVEQPPCTHTTSKRSALSDISEVWHSPVTLTGTDLRGMWHDDNASIGKVQTGWEPQPAMPGKKECQGRLRITFSVSMYIVCYTMIVRHFELQGQQFTNFHYYYEGRISSFSQSVYNQCLLGMWHFFSPFFLCNTTYSSNFAAAAVQNTLLIESYFCRDDMPIHIIENG